MIKLVPDSYGGRGVLIVRKNDCWGYVDVTLQYLDELIEQNVLRITGYLYSAEDDTDTYILDIENSWIN